MIQDAASVVQRRRVPGVARQPEAVRPVGEDVDGVGNLVRGERRGEAVGVLGRDVRVLGRMPEEERRRRRRDQCIQGGRATELRRRILPQQDQAGRAVRLGLHRRDRVAEHREVNRFARLGAGRERGQAGEVPARGEPDHWLNGTIGSPS